jgi:predicted kinase
MNISPGKDRDRGRVIYAAKDKAREYLRSKQSFVWNATNTTRSLRQQLIDFFVNYQARIRIVYLEVSLDELW